MNVTDEGYSTNAPYTSNEMPFDYNHERIGAIRQKTGGHCCYSVLTRQAQVLFIGAMLCYYSGTVLVLINYDEESIGTIRLQQDSIGVNKL